MFWSGNICRICTQISNICIPIFEKDLNPGTDLKLKRCMTSNISKDDLKPKQLCQDCFTKLNDFYNFVMLFHDSNYKFENILFHSTTNTHGILTNSDCVDLDLSLVATQDNTLITSKPAENLSDCSNLATMMVQYKDDMLTLENLDMQTRDFGEQTILNQIVDQTVVNNEVPMNVQNFVSDSSNHILGEINHNLENVSVLRHSSDKIRRVESLQNSYLQQDNLTSEIDQKNVTNFNKNTNEIDMQSSSNNVQNYYISDCIVINNETNSIASKNTPPTNSKNNKIRINSNNVISVKTVRKTMKLLTEDKVPAKPKFNNKIKKLREESNSKSKQFICAICQKSFARKQHLTEHTLSKHSKMRPFECDQCGKTFAIQWELASHKRIHTNLYRCKHCSKGFSAPSKLERHIRIHTGERPFVCTVDNCGRSFSDKRNLIGHQVTHTNVRNFTCDICCQSYKTNSQLKDHKQAHSVNPAFICDICRKSYKWKTNLIIHMRKHTGYECARCKKDCGKFSLLMKHRKECKKDTNCEESI